MRVLRDMVIEQVFVANRFMLTEVPDVRQNCTAGALIRLE